MAGEEILIADGAGRDRQGLCALAEQMRLVPSVADGFASARERLERKFFPVLLVDLDLPGGAMELVRFAREHSAATQIVATTTRKNPDGAIDAFRHGCIDVVVKGPEELPRLGPAINSAIARYHAGSGQGLRPVEEAVDALIKTVLALGRELYASEIDSLTHVAGATLSVLVVDDDPRALKEISAPIEGVAMETFAELSAGGALDRLGAHHFDLVVVKKSLSDLPGALVIAAAQQRHAECIALAYDTNTGVLERSLEGKTLEVLSNLHRPSDVATQLRQLVEDEHTRRRERRVLQVIGTKHGDVLRRYAEARRQLEALRRSR